MRVVSQVGSRNCLNGWSLSSVTGTHLHKYTYVRSHTHTNTHLQRCVRTFSNKAAQLQSSAAVSYSPLTQRKWGTHTFPEFSVFFFFSQQVLWQVSLSSSTACGEKRVEHGCETFCTELSSPSLFVQMDRIILLLSLSFSSLPPPAHLSISI